METRLVTSGDFAELEKFLNQHNAKMKCMPGTFFVYEIVVKPGLFLIDGIKTWCLWKTEIKEIAKINLVRGIPVGLVRKDLFYIFTEAGIETVKVNRYPWLGPGIQFRNMPLHFVDVCFEKTSLRQLVCGDQLPFLTITRNCFYYGDLHSLPTITALRRRRNPLAGALPMEIWRLIIIRQKRPIFLHIFLNEERRSLMKELARLVTTCNAPPSY